MNHWKSKSWVWLCVVLVALLTSCYHKTAPRRGAMVLYNEHQQDSLSFQATHHYTNNFNFIVDKDSLELMRQHPEEILSVLPVDTLKVYKNNHLLWPIFGSSSPTRWWPATPYGCNWLVIRILSDGFRRANCCRRWCLMTLFRSLSTPFPTFICLFFSSLSSLSA